MKRENPFCSFIKENKETIVLFTIMLFVLIVGCRSKDTNYSTNQTIITNNDETEKSMETLSEIFTKAVQSKGESYLSYEQELAKSRPKVNLLLNEKLTSKNPIERLIAFVLLAWEKDKEQTFMKALVYIDVRAPFAVKNTPLINPAPDVVVSYLLNNFNKDIAPLLLLRLIKAENWPDWKATSILLYLKKIKLPETTEGLIRFASETNNEHWRELAIEVIKEIRHPKMPIFIESERKRFEEMEMQFPEKVDQLSPRNRDE